MPTHSIIRAADLQPRPWPNGRGITRDVAAQDRTDQGFGWLISIADLTESAEFSHFPYCDRIFTLIEGNGATLHLLGGDPMACKFLVPACFPGDVATYYTMHAGPARALNVFVDRRSFNAQVSVAMISSSHAFRCGPRTEAIFCASGSLDIEGTTLNPGDTIVGTGASMIHTVDGTSTVLIAEIGKSEIERRQPT